jgi:hypothetical protein
VERKRAFRAALVVALTAAALLVPAAPALASSSIGGSLTMPVAMTAGTAGVGSFRVTNQNTAPDQGSANTLTSIRLAPSCGAPSTLANPCPTPDPGVFSINSPALGAAGSSCAGITFTVSAPDASGIVTFTPSSTVALNGVGSFCEVNFTFDVIKPPAIDVDPGAVGAQTRVNLHVTASTPGGLMLTVRPSTVVTVAGANPVTVADFDGDGDTDVSIYRPSTGGWYIEGKNPVFFGLAGDVPVPGNYDGDIDADISVFRPSVGGWYVQGGGPVFFGLNGDIPVPANYDGGGNDDIAVFRPAVGGWYRQGQDAVFFGLNGDIPVPGDYDGDGDDDIAVYRPSVGGWYIQGQEPVFFGLNGDVPVPGDYDGDGNDEIAVFRPSVGGWYVQGMATQFFGLSGDIPVPGSYDADDAYERAVFRRTTGAWFIEGGTTQFLGGAGDIPLPLPNAIYRFFTFAGA